MSSESRAKAMTDEDILELFVESDEPVLTTLDVAEEFDVTQQAAHWRLSNLHEEGMVERRKIGARAVVWWLNR